MKREAQGLLFSLEQLTQMTLQQSSLKNKLNFDDIDIFAILFHMHEGVLIADRDGTILYYNTAQSKIDEFEIDYAVGKKITDLYKLSESGSTTMQCIRTGRAVRNHVIVYQTRFGKVANTISNVFPLFKDGNVIGAISFTKDYQMLEEILSVEGKVKKPRTRDNGTRFTFSDLIGNNQGLLQAVKMAQLSADSPSPIMLSGETGTGKELFAQSIHNHRTASNEKFIPINCSAIPENLLEGILFGTSKGAFTGSIDKAGLFEQANGGTIFLDELDSMPMALQAKMLRVVQEKRVRRLGSLEETDLNIKIISTVSKDPHQIIKTGVLRQDLFYRMGVVFITIPPLRERMDDLERLVTHFISKLNKTLGEQVKGLSSRVKDLFHEYHWPGNVRELEHVIEGAMNLVNGEKRIKLKHLPPHVVNAFQHTTYNQQTREKGVESHEESKTAVEKEAPYPAGSPFQSMDAESPGRGSVPTRPLTLFEAQCASEQESICYALKCTFGNAAKAARMLGISPQSFHYKLKKYKINRKDFFSGEQP